MVEYGAAVDSTHHRQFLQTHLRRAIFPNGDAGMRAGEHHVRLGERAHANLIVGTAEEGGEGRDERPLLHPR
jgi:hypothetical protein